jgi:hypothetical protein
MLRPILEEFRRRPRPGSWTCRRGPVHQDDRPRGGPRRVLPRSGGRAPETELAEKGKLRDIVFHELFHVYSSHHPELRRDLYGVVGFEVCPEIELPPALARRRLTNPDAPRMDAFIRLPAAGARPSRRRRSSWGVRTSTTRRSAGRSSGRWTSACWFSGRRRRERAAAGPFPDGAPRFVPPGDDYMARIGRNTEYILHPEEILADNFVLLVNGAKVPSPEILTRLDAVLRTRRR